MNLLGRYHYVICYHNAFCGNLISIRLIFSQLFIVLACCSGEHKIGEVINSLVKQKGNTKTWKYKNNRLILFFCAFISELTKSHLNDCLTLPNFESKFWWNFSGWPKQFVPPQEDTHFLANWENFLYSVNFIFLL